MSIKDGLETNEHGHPEYQEAIVIYGNGRSAWLRTEIQTEVPHEGKPSLAECRYAAMRLHNKGNGYVVYDRALSRIVDGVYYGDDALTNALGVAQLYNETGEGAYNSPNGSALGLIYPSKHNLPEWDGTWKSKDWLEK
jgi:hypothetical protein